MPRKNEILIDQIEVRTKGTTMRSPLMYDRRVGEIFANVDGSRFVGKSLTEIKSRISHFYAVKDDVAAADMGLSLSRYIQIDCSDQLSAGLKMVWFLLDFKEPKAFAKCWYANSDLKKPEYATLARTGNQGNKVTTEMLATKEIIAMSEAAATYQYNIGVATPTYIPFSDEAMIHNVALLELHSHYRYLLSQEVRAVFALGGTFAEIPQPSQEAFSTILEEIKAHVTREWRRMVENERLHRFNDLYHHGQFMTRLNELR